MTATNTPVDATAESAVRSPSGRRSAMRWAGKGFWAVTDQGLFAGSNFLLNILLARWLGPAEYGAFAVAFTIFLLLGTFHTALLTEPMLVFGAGRFKDRLPQYLGTLLYGHLLFALPAGLLLGLGALACWWADAQTLAIGLASLALAQPFILLLWLLRKACYIRSNPRQAATVGAGYMVLMLAGLILLHRLEWVTIAAAMMVMGASSLLAVLALCWRLDIDWRGPADHATRSEAIREHWRYGRWSTPTQGLNFVPVSIHFLFLPMFATMDQVGAFKALANFLLPMRHASAALCGLLVPKFVTTLARGGATRLLFTVMALLSLGAVAAWLALGLFHSQLFTLAYGDNFAAYAPLLWLAGAIPVLATVLNVLSAFAKAHERPELVFRACLVASGVAIGVGLPAAMFYGIAGCFFAIGAAYIVSAAGMLWLMRGLYNNRSKGRYG